MSFYAHMQHTATRLLNCYGQGQIRLIRPGAPVAAVNSWDEPAAGDPVIYELSGVKRGVSQHYVDGSTVLASDEQITFAAFEDAPRVGDGLTFDGVPLTILQVIPLSGQAIAWTVIVRQ